jgi:hypothetical protein
MLGHGGIRAVPAATGVREATVSAGVDELEASIWPAAAMARTRCIQLVLTKPPAANAAGRAAIWPCCRLTMLPFDYAAVSVSGKSRTHAVYSVFTYISHC